MRLSTLVWVWTFAAVAAGTALADSDEVAALESASAEEVAAAPAAEPLSDADSAALDAIAPEATAAAPDGTAAAPEETAAAPSPSDDADPMGFDPASEVTAPDTQVMQARETATWDDFEDPGFDPGAPAAAPDADSATPKARLSAKAAAIPLGPLGVDEEGVEGRIHTVSRGETLWDISEAYLGTPWVWPSVWHENAGIDNPHVIEPGDRIWITSNEMRRISEEEADQMVAAVTELPEDDLDFLPEDEIAYEDDQSFDTEEPMPAAVEDTTELSVAVPMEALSAETGEVIVLPKTPDANFATADLVEGAATIVDAPSIRAFLTQGDEVYLPLGEGEVQRGDEFEVFRDVIRVRDIETNAVLGYHYDELGWLSIERVEGESSVGVIQGAWSEIQRGDKIVPRNKPPQEIAVRRALEDIEGAIVFTPGIRWMRGTTDSVYINVGSIHGVEVGTRMQVIDRGKVLAKTMMPDTIIAELVVIDVEPETSIAYITGTERELEVGDDVRGVMDDDPYAMP